MFNQLTQKKINMDVLELTKKEIQEGAYYDAVTVIEDGKEDLLNAYMFAMSKAEYYTAFAKQLHDAAMIEFETYGDKEVELRGRKVSKFEAGVKYDFSNCGHVELDSLGRVKKDVEAKMKAFQEQIKYISESQTMVNDDGEIFTVIPPTKTSTTKIKLRY